MDDEPEGIGARRALEAAVGRCLAAGIGPRRIMADVGAYFWKLRPDVQRPDGRWPWSPMGGWSEDPATHEQEVRP